MSTKFGLLVTVIVSCALVSAQGKPGIVHTDVKSGYAIVLPSGFKKESAADPIGNVQFTGPTDNGFAASVAIIGFPCESETPESIGKAAVAQVKNDPSYKVISAGIFKSSTISGYTWLYERKLPDGAVIMQKGFVSVKKSTAAVVNFVAEKAAFPKYEKLVQESLNSFKWNK